jgi:hypothetical protein
MNDQRPVVVSVSKAIISTAASIAAVVGVLNSKAAMGATVTYDFTVDVYTGAYIGKYNGSFSYAGSTTLVPCKSGGVQTVCANRIENNLTVQFDFLGNTYTENQERDLSADYPRVFFPLSETSGGLSFLVVSPRAPVGFFILGHTFRVGNTEGDDPYGSEEDNVGNVVYKLRLPNPDTQPGPPPDPAPDNGAAAVPEPSEIAGSTLALGLLGLGWYRRRSKAVVMDQDKNR